MSLRRRLLPLAACAAFALPAFADRAHNEAIARAALEELLGQGRFEVADRLHDPSHGRGDDRDQSIAEVEASVRRARAALPDLAVRIDRRLRKRGLLPARSGN